MEQRRDQTGNRLSHPLGGPGGLQRRLGEARRRHPSARQQEQGDLDQEHHLQPEHAVDGRLLRAMDLQVLGTVRGAGGRRSTNRAPDLAGDRTADRRQVGPELGRRPRRLTGLCPQGRQPRRTQPAGARGDVRARAADLHVPAAHLQPLPQSDLRRVLPVRRAIQARRGRHRAAQPGALPRLAHVHHRLPVQEDLLQLVDWQVGEVPAVLSAARGRHSPGLLPHLRRPHPLSRRDAVRRRQDPGDGVVR